MPNFIQNAWAWGKGEISSAIDHVKGAAGDAITALDDHAPCPVRATLDLGATGVKTAANITSLVAVFVESPLFPLGGAAAGTLYGFKVLGWPWGPLTGAAAGAWSGFLAYKFIKQDLPNWKERSPISRCDSISAWTIRISDIAQKPYYAAPIWLGGSFIGYMIWSDSPGAIFPFVTGAVAVLGSTFFQYPPDPDH